MRSPGAYSDAPRARPTVALSFILSPGLYSEAPLVAPLVVGEGAACISWPVDLFDAPCFWAAYAVAPINMAARTIIVRFIGSSVVGSGDNGKHREAFQGTRPRLPLRSRNTPRRPRRVSLVHRRMCGGPPSGLRPTAPTRPPGKCPQRQKPRPVSPSNARASAVAVARSSAF